MQISGPSDGLTFESCETSAFRIVKRGIERRRALGREYQITPELRLENVLIVGTPAKIAKRNIAWKP